MATYKVPQNVEAEDKLIGPFTFKQFLFLIVAVISAWLTWALFQATPFLALITLPITLVFGFLGVYRREDQPVETYLLAFINFLFKPRRRLWDSERITEAVRIVARKIEHPTVVARNPKEVKGQLHRLAQIIDTRGWSTKNPIIQEPTVSHAITQEDRIVLPQQLLQPQPTEPIDVHVSDDVLDVENNPQAQDLSEKAQATTEQVKQTAVAKMQAAIGQGEIKKSQRREGTAVRYNPYPSIQQHTLDPTTGAIKQPDSAAGGTADILHLAQSGQDLTVSQIAAQAERYHQQQITANQEIKLRGGTNGPNQPDTNTPNTG